MWNGLTDKEHPTQMLADFMTMKENFGTLEGLTLAYCGQGRNNVQNSLMITSAILGVNYVNAHAGRTRADPAIVEVARALRRRERRYHHGDERPGGGGGECRRHLHERVGGHGRGVSVR